MDSFKQLIIFAVGVSLPITFVQIYLMVNKIWKRKHERAVAESQSIVGLSLMFLNCVLWTFYYIFVKDMPSLIETSFYLFQSFIFLLISTGLWVQGQQSMRLWTLVRRALRLERKEANYLIKRFFRPANAETILHILHQLAMIDNEMDPKELELLEAFAKEWNIDYSDEKMNKQRTKGADDNFIRLRKSVVDYLHEDPPIEQVAQLRDMMTALIHADDKISPEEELIVDELMGLISNSLKKDEMKFYNVLIVPQKSDHDELIKELVPDAQEFHASGGTAFSIGTFYSSKYAEMICNQYREINLFTIVHSPSAAEGTERNNTTNK